MTKEEREELGLPLRQADPDTFKHEPPDYEQPVEAVTVEQIKPCPFCGEQCADLIINQGTKWAHYEPSCLEVRTGYDLSDYAAWRTEAIAAWNTRTQANETMRSLDGAREAFLDLLADARDYHWEPDGDETGDHTTVHIISHWRQFQELALALGIPAPSYMQTWEDRIDAALSGDSA